MGSHGVHGYPWTPWYSSQQPGMPGTLGFLRAWVMFHIFVELFDGVDVMLTRIELCHGRSHCLLNLHLFRDLAEEGCSWPLLGASSAIGGYFVIEEVLLH
jgi:hypothetical protein